jgi:hypothetical protein
MSTLAWLDYSEHDRRVALDVIDRFRDQDTRDELGIGAIRDGFADLFFPGTGTVQTRARYFFFVPWIYLRLEKSKVPSAEVRHKARLAEVTLIKELLASGEEDGVIGRLRREKLKRLPSSIYWQGLGTLGFLRFRGSQEQYHRYLDRFYRTGGLTLRADDGELVDRLSARNWHAGLPEPPRDFTRGVTLDLTHEEAEFLRDRIVQERPESLFRHLAEANEPPSQDAEFPWEKPGVQDIPAHLQGQLEHARNFSEIMHGAALLYNLILARLAEDDDLIEEYKTALKQWNSLLATRQKAHSAWDRAAFWHLVHQTGANVSMRARAFCDRWIDFALGPDARRVASAPAAESLIRAREFELKRRQARVLGGRALEIWSGGSGTRRLNYRWPVASRMLADLHAALS